MRGPNFYTSHRGERGMRVRELTNLEIGRQRSPIGFTYTYITRGNDRKFSCPIAYVKTQREGVASSRISHQGGQIKDMKHVLKKFESGQKNTCRPICQKENSFYFRSLQKNTFVSWRKNSCSGSRRKISLDLCIFKKEKKIARFWMVYLKFISLIFLFVQQYRSTLFLPQAGWFSSCFLFCDYYS